MKRSNPNLHSTRPRTRHGSARTGCGCVTIPLALLSIIALVGFLIAGMADRIPTHQSRLPIPDDVPPAAASRVPHINIHAPGRTSQQLQQWAHNKADKLGIPPQALMAYGNAEAIARATRPQCGLSWNTVAALGFVETRHGTYSGKKLRPSHLDQSGYAVPPIFGPPLDGRGQFARVEDTDQGRLDGLTDLDRAVGPMQFIPESWRRYGVDANGDGKAEPQNIDDAAASAVRLLCDYDRDLRTPEGWTQAIRSYNASDQYVRDVRDAAAHYALGQRAGH